MSDNVDLDDLGEGDAPESGGGGAKKKGGGLGNLLPNILKFVAIGLGATVFIVTVSIITVNLVSKKGAQQTVIGDPSSPYVGKMPEYTYYDGIGSITVRTKDFPVSSSVTVKMILGYDLNDQLATTELISRRFQLIDFVRRYFSSKTAVELSPEREEELKAEIREMLNTRFLDTARVRIVLFEKLDVMEQY